MKATNRVRTTKNHTVIDTTEGDILNVSHGKRLSSFRLCLLQRSKLLRALNQWCSRGPCCATCSCCKAQKNSERFQDSASIGTGFFRDILWSYWNLSKILINLWVFSSSKSLIGIQASEAQPEQKWGSHSLGIG